MKLVILSAAKNLNRQSSINPVQIPDASLSSTRQFQIRSRCIIDILGCIFDVYCSFGFAGVLKLYPNVIHSSQNRFNLIGPLNQNHRLRITEIVEAQHLKLRYGIKPIGIDMVNIQPARILIDYNKCRAIDVFLVFRTCSGGYPLDQVRLAAAQRPADSNNFTAVELLAKITP